MKVRDVIDFLSSCNPDAEVICEDNDGYSHQLYELDSGEFFHLDDDRNMLITIDCVYTFFRQERFK
jgi:hypothetical protein